MTLHRIAWTFLLMLGFSFPAAALDPAQPIVTDSRIKTFVYNPNDVYTITTLYGYQTNIEFGLLESIETISVGDRIAWQIMPSGRRLFIRAMEDNARTNMTVVTNRRAYQFDLQSINSTSRNTDEIVYVARFFYPEEASTGAQAVIDSVDLSNATAGSSYNFNYTYAGPETLAPVKIFDDGKSTYFKFRGAQLAGSTLSVVQPGGQETPVTASPMGEYLVAPVTAARFALRQGNNVLCIFNEALAPSTPVPAIGR